MTSIPRVARIFMRTAPHNYLRTFRKRSALTQVDIAFLLGARSGAKVSRLERLSRFPNLKTAFACQVIFGVPADALFPGLYRDIASHLAERAKVLRLTVSRRESTRGSERRVKMLDGIVTRTSQSA